MIWSPDFVTDVCRINRIMNIFLYFSGLVLYVTYSPYDDHGTVIQVVDLNSLQERRKSFGTHFIWGTVKWSYIDASRILEGLVVRVQNRTGHLTFFICPWGKPTFQKRHVPLTI